MGRNAHAGFSAVRPWLPLPESCAEVNVASQRAERSSIFHNTGG
jgi:hypothetical protein